MMLSAVPTAVRTIWYVPTVARIYRITFVCAHSNGALAEPSLHYQTDLNPLEDEPDPGDVANDIWGHFNTAFRNCLHSETTVLRIDAREEVLPPDIGAAGTHGVNLPGTGFTGTVGLPHALCAVVNRHTGVASRSARGWFHMPSPLQQTCVAGDVWGSTYETTLDALAALLDDTIAFGGIGTGHYNPVVYSRTRHGRGLTPYAWKVTAGVKNRQPKFLRSRYTIP